MNSEPSVLDFVKAILTPWRGAPPRIPPLESSDILETDSIGSSGSPPSQLDGNVTDQTDLQTSAQPAIRALVWPWRAIIALGLALFAQLSLEPSVDRSWQLGVILYVLAAGWVVWANVSREWELAAVSSLEPRSDPMTIQNVNLIIGLVMSLLAFLTLGGNRFTSLNVLLWILGLLFFILAFWLPGSSKSNWFANLQSQFKYPVWNVHISHWTLVFVLATGFVLFFRLYLLNAVPREMVSDHAEKILDIWDVLNGNTSIFFPRNTGREALQMYLTAGVIKIFGTGYTFLSLKIGAAIAGLLTLPFIYLLGVELGNRRAGILAALFAGIAYWPNVITRVALRFPLYPLFVAPTLFFLIRGLRRSNRNDFILAGLSLGIGLHGYTPFRIMPFVILVAVGLYMLHRQSQGLRKRTLWYLVLLGLIALIAFLPLARFWMENPDLFSYRAFTRLGSIEQPLSGPAWLIFMNNLGRAVTMFAWNNGEIWPVSIPYRPALDVVSAALFYLGIVLLLVRYIRQRNWVDLFLILSVPLLLLPSILSLAFPNENPALNRMAGAIVPVFLIVGLSLDGFLNGLETKFSMPFNTKAAWGIGAILLLWAAVQNFNLVFDEYRTNYELSSWNTSEIGQVIKDYTDSFVAPENAYVVAYPYWVDTRLVGINAGFPTRDFALWPQQFSETLSQSGPKLFVIKPEDQNSIAVLQSLYPEGYLQLYPSKFENKDFYLFTVLPQVGDESGS